MDWNFEIARGRKRLNTSDTTPQPLPVCRSGSGAVAGGGGGIYKIENRHFFGGVCSADFVGWEVNNYDFPNSTSKLVISEEVVEDGCEGEIDGAEDAGESTCDAGVK